MSPFTYLTQVRAEFAHIVWPTSRKAIAHTLVVIFIALIIALIISLLDYVFGGLVGRIVGY